MAIKPSQFEDASLRKICDKVLSGEAKEAITDSEGVLRIKQRVFFPCVDDLIRKILEESHSSRYSIHPGATKMYHDLRKHYWWARVKHDIVEFVSQCLNWQQVTYTTTKLAQIYICEIVRLHGVPISIATDRDTTFASQFWRTLESALGTRLDLSTTFHSQTDGQSERMIQIVCQRHLPNLISSVRPVPDQIRG
ncbi:uncharacterized protein LOC132628744 [Lycium barbarum]|uniref:uncharacterized protein LOC132628744 n=1 Tax=Lycium barbarum TaxID=112863 RepID=UPI00293E5B4C|nr:uncharacterized protein LOC132628744 [Lycium barbarum]